MKTHFLVSNFAFFLPTQNVDDFGKTLRKLLEVYWSNFHNFDDYPYKNAHNPFISVEIADI